MGAENLCKDVEARLQQEELDPSTVNQSKVIRQQPSQSYTRRGQRFENDTANLLAKENSVRAQEREAQLASSALVSQNAVAVPQVKPPPKVPVPPPSNSKVEKRILLKKKGVQQQKKAKKTSSKKVVKKRSKAEAKANEKLLRQLEVSDSSDSSEDDDITFLPVKRKKSNASKAKKNKASKSTKSSKSVKQSSRKRGREEMDADYVPPGIHDSFRDDLKHRRMETRSHSDHNRGRSEERSSQRRSDDRGQKGGIRYTNQYFKRRGRH